MNVLTIAFDFDGKTYLAQARILKDDDGSSTYAIQLFSDGLNRILPEGRIQYCPKKMSELKPANPKADKLIRSINEAMIAHLRIAGRQ